MEDENKIQKVAERLPLTDKLNCIQIKLKDSRQNKEIVT